MALESSLSPARKGSWRKAGHLDLSMRIIRNHWRGLSVRSDAYRGRSPCGLERWMDWQLTRAIPQTQEPVRRFM